MAHRLILLLVALQQQRTTALEHRLACLIEIRTSHLLASAYGNTISTLHALAAKGIKTHMDGMRQHGGARSAIPSVMVDQESAYVTVEISRYSGEYAIYISDEYGVPLSNTNGIVEGRTYSILETEDLPIGNYTIMIVLGNLVYKGKFHITH
jgi:hypothetical protein